jgi:hypothetical protein
MYLGYYRQPTNFSGPSRQDDHSVMCRYVLGPLDILTLRVSFQIFIRDVRSSDVSWDYTPGPPIARSARCHPYTSLDFPPRVLN